MPLYLGLDSSTQSLTAIVIDSDTQHGRLRVVADLRRGAAALRHQARRAAARPARRGDVVAGDVGGSARRDVRPDREERPRRRPHRGHLRLGAAARQRVSQPPRRGGESARSIPRSRSPGRWRRCCRARNRRSGWTRARAPSAARSPTPSAARVRSASTPARARSSGSRGRRSASSSRPIPPRMTRPAAFTW